MTHTHDTVGFQEWLPALYNLTIEDVHVRRGRLARWLVQTMGAPPRRYNPTAKHKPGGWGTLMDLDDATAAEVLNSGIVGPNGRQVYGFHSGRVYEFQPDNLGGYHGYPIPGREAPPSVLTEMRDNGIITNAEYRRLIRGR